MNNQPFISVIIPVYNGEKFLPVCLDAVRDNSYQHYELIVVDDCSTDLSLRGLPVFRGLIGPMPEGRNIVRYESPDVFETMTKEWTSAKTARKPRRRMTAPEAIDTADSARS